MEKFATGQVWLSRDGEKRVIAKILEDGAAFPIYSESLNGEDQQVHTIEGRMHLEVEHGADLVKHIGFALKDGELPPPLKSILEALAASVGDSDEGEDEGKPCDCELCSGGPAETLRELTGTLDKLMAKKAEAQEREFADRLILALMGNPNAAYTVPELIDFAQTVLDARKTLKF